MKNTNNLPKIALGAWSWGTGAVGGDQVFGNHLTAKDLKPVFDTAMTLGLNLWDTAYVYGMGASEEILGEFVKSENRDDVILLTKFTPNIASDSPNAVQEMLDGSKSRLHVDVIDLYWLHNSVDSEKWTPELIPMLKTGQVKAVGVSNHSLAELKRANEILGKEGFKVSAVQNHFSLLHRNSEESGILNYCKENDITFYSYMVLEQGALTGRYDKEHPFADGTGRAGAYNTVLSELDALISEMRDIAKVHEASVAGIATAWAIAKGTLPIIGVTKANHVEDAAKSMKIELSDDEISRMERLADEAGIKTLREWETSVK